MGQNLGPPQTNLPCPDRNKGRTPFAKTRLGKNLKRGKCKRCATGYSAHTDAPTQKPIYKKNENSRSTATRPDANGFLAGRTHARKGKQKAESKRHATTEGKGGCTHAFSSFFTISPSARRVHQSTPTSQPLIGCCPFWRFSISSQCL